MATMDRENKIVDSLKEKFGQNILEIKIQKVRRIFATVPSTALKDTISFLKDDFSINHISTISGVDLGKEIGVYYHLMGNKIEGYDNEIVFSLKVTTPKADPKLPTITPIIPGAELYEREIHDMFGVVIEGHPDPRPLVLPEGWPEDVFPLRKEWKVDDIKAKIEKVGGVGSE
ncbi:NADH-quinone oxidoreductase subunit C [[Eubacterium] cellulosolvens]